MRIIDEKGKLFGKINLLDLTIILFFFIIASFIIANTFFSKKLVKKINDVSEKEYVLIDIILPEDSAWIKKHIIIGDISQGLFHGKITAQILGIKETDDFGPNRRLLIKIKAFVEKDRAGTLSFGKYPLRIGQEIIFTTSKCAIEGRIADFNITGEKIIFKD